MSDEKTLKQQVDARGGELLADLHSNYQRLDGTEYQNGSCFIGIGDDGENTSLVLCGNGAMLRTALFNACISDDDLLEIFLDVSKALVTKKIMDGMSKLDFGPSKEESSNDAG